MVSSSDERKNLPSDWKKEGLRTAGGGTSDSLHFSWGKDVSCIKIFFA